MALYAACLILLAEGGAYLTLCAVYGRAISSGTIAARMVDIAAMDANLAAPASGRAGRIVHPYPGDLESAWARDREGLTRSASPDLGAPDSPIHDRDPDTVVVAVSGGSLAARFSQPQGLLRLGQRLAELPRFAGKRLRCVSLAATGWRQPRQWMALSDLLALGGRVDVLVDLGGVHEVVPHEMEDQVQGLSPIDPGAWTALGRGDELAELLQDTHAARVAAARRALGSPLRHLWTYRLWWRWRDGRAWHAVRTLQDELRGLRDDGTPRDARAVLELGPRAHGVDRASRLEELVGNWERSTLRMHALCAAHGIEYFVFLQPDAHVPDSKPWTEDELAHAIDSHPARVRELVRDGYPALRAAGGRLRDEHGVRFGDLTSVFQDVRETVYVDDRCHVNERGGDLIAAEIARAIQAALP